MDPISIVTIVASAIGLATKISSELFPLINTINRAPHSITLIETEVRNLSDTLQTVQAHFNPQSTNYTTSQLEQLLRVTTETKATLAELAAVIARVKGRTRFRGVRWSAVEGDVERYRVGLGSCTAQLNILVATLSDQRGANIEAMVRRCLEIAESQPHSAASRESPPLYTSSDLAVTSQDLHNNLMAAAEASTADNIIVRETPWPVPCARHRNIGPQQVRFQDFPSSDFPGEPFPGGVTLRFIKNNAKHRIQVELLLQNGIRHVYEVLEASYAVSCDRQYQRGVVIRNLVNEEAPTTAIELTCSWKKSGFDFFGNGRGETTEIEREFNLLKQLPKSWFGTPIPEPPKPVKSGKWLPSVSWLRRSQFEPRSRV